MNLALPAFFLTLSLALPARSIEQRLEWDSLPTAEMTGRKVRVTTGNGEEVSGRLTRIEPAALVLGDRTIARDSVLRIDYSPRRRTRWQIIGTAIGVGATLPLVVIAEIFRKNEGGIYAGRNTGIAAAVMGGAAAAGYFAGRAADMDRISIHIVRR